MGSLLIEISEESFMNSPVCVCVCLKVTNEQKALVTHLGFVKTFKYPHSTLLTPSVGFYACSWRHNGDETAECGLVTKLACLEFTHKRAASFPLVAYRYEQYLH